MQRFSKSAPGTLVDVVSLVLAAPSDRDRHWIWASVIYDRRFAGRTDVSVSSALVG